MESMVLAHRDFEGGPTQPVVVCLHGLLGSSRNWQGAGRLLAERAHVYAVDLRNHGASPHADEMTYDAMLADLLHWLDRQGLEQVHLVGHSMGGKVAMALACRNASRCASLTVVDIAPKAYPPRWEREFAALCALPVERLQNRAEAEAILEPSISDWAFRKFLVSNLERQASGGFRWSVNLKVLQTALPNLFGQIPQEGESYAGPTLFLRGERSRFVEESDVNQIERFFPLAEVKTVAEAGHNVHFDQTAAFVHLVREHVERVS